MDFHGTERDTDQKALDSFGLQTAKELRLSGTIGLLGTYNLLSSRLRVLSRRASDFEKTWTEGEAPVAAQWLTDNLYLIKSQGAAALSLFRRGPRLTAAGTSPALFCLCRSLINYCGGKLTEDVCRFYFTGCQKKYVLSTRELSLLSPMLITAIIDELGELYASGTLTEVSALPAERLISSLRLLSTLDLSPLLEDIDRVDQLYLQDPGGIYPRMTRESRAYYRHRTAHLARIQGISEHALAEKILKLSQEAPETCRHIGFQLFSGSLTPNRSLLWGRIYSICLPLLSHGLSLAAGLLSGSFWAAVLSFIPAWEIVKTLMDGIITRLVPPRHTPRLELKDGVPPEGRSLCVISALLTSPEKGPLLARHLEEYCLANQSAGENLVFGILADLPDDSQAVSNKDEAVLQSARDAVEALNVKYGSKFFLFTRERTFNPRDKKYMAWERKRGALWELGKMLFGGNSRITISAGSKSGPGKVRYIITLDEDTRLAPESAAELIGAMLHPLNTPVLGQDGTVISGHGVIQPRIIPRLASVNKSGFSRIFAVQGGRDPYGGHCSEVYEDAFDSGGFAGKGIIDVTAFLSALDNRIPENTVLSHDALEGAFLRGGLMSDLELTEGFPGDVYSYFRRLHRWIRGDWQNIPWIFRRGRGIAPVDRFRLLDSIRRSLFPLSCLVSFLWAFFSFSSGGAAAALFALTALGLRLVLSLIKGLFSPFPAPRLRSGILRGVNARLTQLLTGLILLPTEAWTGLSAAVTALWRMLISKRNLLRWTPASVFDGAADGVLKYFSFMAPACILGLALLVFCPSVPGKTAGLVWLISPAFAFALSQKEQRPDPLTGEDRDWLRARSGEIWRFFRDHCTAEDNYLPPDNYQEQPVPKLAHRTSPTNIGLCLLSCLAALDLGLASRQEALGIVENILSTLKKMPKWQGHLYNWYDTQSLEPLRPVYVSTVDSGNLAACLIILRQGLAETGNNQLAQCCSELLEQMSFAPLYDSRRQLMSIGTDPSGDLLSSGCYDLMASEARTASYIAAAKGEVPIKHWRCLSRAQVTTGTRRGMVSWTGSMFEYLMPRLFFPSEKGSVLYETEGFCIDVHRQRTKKSDLPWGVSESAFHSLDAALNYRYKAHGCGALALKKGMDSELVVSPYSSFLALCRRPEAAVKNLRRLEKAGILGRYGFWEAIDYTPSRSGGRRGAPVRCVMAHHLGMSLVAAANCLLEDIMPRRFMADPLMAGYRELLEERLPTKGPVLRRSTGAGAEKPSRRPTLFWEQRGDILSASSPECCMLSNGNYNVMLTNFGAAHPTCQGIAPYYTPIDPFSGEHGLELWLLTDKGRVSLMPGPKENRSVKTSWEFNLFGAKLNIQREELRCQTLFTVSPGFPGEKRTISIDPAQGGSSRCTLVVGLTPLLAPYNDYVNHPAFWSLGLEAIFMNGTLIIHRTKRGNVPESYLCLAASEPFSGEFEEGYLSRPRIEVCLQTNIRQGSDNTFSLALATASTREEAYSAALGILAEPPGRGSDYLLTNAESLGMKEKDLETAMELLRASYFPAPLRSSVARSALWPFGISGDLPVICREIFTPELLDEARNLVNAHSFLCLMGRPFDLVFITDEGGNYLRPIGSALEKLRDRNSRLIHLVDRSAGPEPIFARACKPRERPVRPDKLQYLPEKTSDPKKGEPEIHWNKDGSFEFYVNRFLPPKAWGNMLTNGAFGFFAADRGTGYMWYRNAREYKINSFPIDPVSTRGAETLTLEDVNVFAADTEPCKVTNGFGFTRWEKEVNGSPVCLTAFVPFEADCRVLILTWQGGPRRVRWFTDLVLGGSPGPERTVSLSIEGGTVSARGAESPYPHSSFRVCSNRAWEKFFTSPGDFAEDNASTDTEAVGYLGLSFIAESPFVLVCGCDDTEKLASLCFPESAEKSLQATKNRWQDTVSKLRVETPVPALNRLINGWLPYQTLACRIMGRCSMYQSGGAYGFRDQLQDCANLLLLDSSLLRNQILLCCSRQYKEGDVAHWWHDLGDICRGVRTRCSDDLLWLPWALCEYTEKTGDLSLCLETAPWLESPPLDKNEKDRYETLNPTGELSPVIQHCLKAIDTVLIRGFGPHGLLKMGSGDWNDGMDAVGSEGQGESVWLSWFFAHTARRLGELLNKLSMKKDASRLFKAAEKVGKGANSAWDGAWYLRGYFDDGEPLGSSCSRCCRIDSIAQSFAALCPEADRSRVDLALKSAVEKLFKKDPGLILLFDPPFENAQPRPGYIESYGPGYRENGGQYTHAAVWLIMALLKTGHRDSALELIEALIPENKPTAVYGGEPYVLAADVSSAPLALGEAGWTWYTGAAGWLWRVVTEDLLGISLRQGAPEFSPNLPERWKDETLKVSYKGEILPKLPGKDE